MGNLGITIDCQDKWYKKKKGSFHIDVFGRCKIGKIWELTQRCTEKHRVHRENIISVSLCGYSVNSKIKTNY
jgi:hypothetical protein